MQINERIVDVQERARLLAMAHALGCKVYQRKPETDTWFYFTDGTNIGYAQFPRREASKLCSVHKPSKQVGTGFDAGTPATGADMLRAMTMHAPGWAHRDARHVVKWKSWEEFKARDSYNTQYQEVAA